MKFVLNEDDGEHIAFITLDDLFFFHQQSLLDYPDQRRGILNADALKGAVNRPQNYHAYENERDVLRLAAVLWHGVTEAHAFQDGNKRTGFIAMTSFLEANGVELVEDNGFPGRFIDICFAFHSFDTNTLHNFLMPRCRWIT